MCEKLKPCPACGNALPRALHWTKETPKEPGWYWHKNCIGITIMQIKPGCHLPNISDYSWAGPIPEPQE